MIRPVAVARGGRFRADPVDEAFGPGPGRRARRREILVSRTIRDLVAGAPIRLESRGTHELKGVPGSWEIFAVAG